MRYNLKNIVISTLVSAVVLVGAAITATAQDRNDEYRQWQRAQQEAQRQYNQYLRTRSPQDYREWQRAQAIAQREQIEYQRANRMGNAGRGVGWGYGRTRNRRVYYDGRYYDVDNRQLELLRQAVNRGYQQGYRQGQLDRRYGRGFDYNDSDFYERANFGYQSYVAQNQYQHYFRQGFQRGYQDGYYSRTQYGYRSGSTANILGTVLNSILRLADDNPR